MCGAIPPGIWPKTGDLSPEERKKHADNLAMTCQEIMKGHMQMAVTVILGLSLCAVGVFALFACILFSQ